jgi:hypothetical protein
MGEFVSDLWFGPMILDISCLVLQYFEISEPLIAAVSGKLLYSCSSSFNFSRRASRNYKTSHLRK